MEHHYKQLEPGCIFYFPIFAEKKLIEKKSMKRMILLLSFLMVVSWMYGQITLEECRQKTQDNYPLVRQYSLIEKTKEYNLNNASKGNLPQFSLSAKASYQSDVTELPVKIPGIDIKGQPKDQYQVMLELKQKYGTVAIANLGGHSEEDAFPNPNIRLYKEIKRKNIPTLFIHNHYENVPFDSVEMSDSRSAYELTRILIENGHRRIGGIFKYDDMQGIERYKGFIQCLSDYGVKFDDDCIRWYSTKDMEEKLSKKGLLRMYRRTKDCTAMMVYNDEVADYYMEFLEERGLHVPEDISLVSFDDAELQDSSTSIQLVTAVHPKYQLGRITAKHLLRMMDDTNWQQKNYSYRFPVKIKDVHGGFTHLFFNMFALWMFGRILEQVWGPKRFLFYYLVCGIGAGFIQEIVQYVHYEMVLSAYTSVNTGYSVIPMGEYLNMMTTVGASGAIYAILLGFGMLFPNQPLFIFPLPFPIKAKYFVIGYALIELYAGFANNPGDNVAHFAHLGGMIFGFILIMYWRKKDRGNGYYYN